MSTRRLLLSLCAFAVGILLACIFSRIRNIPSSFFILALVYILIGTLFLFLMKWKKIGMIFIMLCMICLGILRTSLSFHQQQISELDPYIFKEVVLYGIVRGDTDTRQTGDKITIALQNILDTSQRDDPSHKIQTEQSQILTQENHTALNKDRASFTAVTTKILVTTERRSNLHHGDHVELHGRLEIPESFQTDTGRVFNYPMYLAKDGITHIMKDPVIQIIEEGKPGITRTLLRIKSSLITSAQRFLPFPEVGLLSGILYGEKGGLNQKTLDNFRTTGIVHIVVLSGANVTLIAVFLLNIFSRISRRFGFIIGSVGILAFAIMTGGGTTTLRASIMALLAVGTQWFGREYDITRALAIAGFIMIAFNPLTLLYDISFQLSFLATIGLVYIGPLIEPFIRWMPKQFELRSNFLATIATQIFVLPLLMYSTGQVSIISIIVNLLALPFIPYAMLFGFLSSLAGFLFAPLAWILSLPTYFFLTVPLRLVDLFSRISWASVTLPQIPMWSLILCYLILFCIAVKQGKKMSSQFL